MNTDPRGVKRGQCLAEDCDCTCYEHEESSGPKCVYCCCPPTKHRKLDMNEETLDMNEETLTNSSLGVDASATSGASSENVAFQQSVSVEVIQQAEMMPVTAVYSYSPPLHDLLPKKLPKPIEVALQNKCLTPPLRNKIVRAIADKCFEESLPSKMVDSVASIAVQKWSPLKNQFGDFPAASFATQIKRRLSKLKLNSKATGIDKSVIEVDEASEFNQEEMKAEMQRPTPSHTKLKQFLDGTRVARKKEVSCKPALEIIKLYPALKISDLLLWEFTKIVNISEINLIERFKIFINSMVEYLRKTEDFDSLNESQESLTVVVLQKLPAILPSGKRTKQMTKNVLEVYEESTAISKTVPEKTDPPRLIAIGDPKKEITFFCYVDGTAIFTATCPIKATLLLLSVYWVFNIEFYAESKPTFLLLSAAILKTEMPTAHLAKASAVNCLLKQLNL